MFSPSGKMTLEMFMSLSVSGFAFLTEAVQPGSRRPAAHPDASQQHIARHVQKRRSALPTVGWVRTLTDHDLLVSLCCVTYLLTSCERIYSQSIVFCPRSSHQQNSHRHFAYLVFWSTFMVFFNLSGMNEHMQICSLQHSDFRWILHQVSA